jgi:hypothetical protein
MDNYFLLRSEVINSIFKWTQLSKLGSARISCDKILHAMAVGRLNMIGFDSQLSCVMTGKGDSL